jgi:hypothetical protein
MSSCFDGTITAGQLSCLAAGIETAHPGIAAASTGAVNRELVLLYWRIGPDILVRQERERWGAKVVDRLAADLQKAFT